MKRINADLIQLSATVRIERGYVRKRAIATPELLQDSVTASHYRIGAPDALGDTIQLGKLMAYIDWRGPDREWYVYRLTTVTEYVQDEPVNVERYICYGAFESEGDAIEFGRKL